MDVFVPGVRFVGKGGEVEGVWICGVAGLSVRILSSQGHRAQLLWEGMRRRGGNDPSGHDFYQLCPVGLVPEYNLINFLRLDPFLFEDDFG